RQNGIRHATGVNVLVRAVPLPVMPISSATDVKTIRRVWLQVDRLSQGERNEITRPGADVVSVADAGKISLCVGGNFSRLRREHRQFSVQRLCDADGVGEVR